MSQEILKRIEEIEARAAKATPGPWAYGEAETEQWVEADDGLVVYREYYTKPDPAVYKQTKRDFEFIAHVRESSPWLCKTSQELLDRLSKLESAARLALQALTEGMADVPAERDKRCAALRVKAKRALREALGLAPREGNDGDL